MITVLKGPFQPKHNPLYGAMILKDPPDPTSCDHVKCFPLGGEFMIPNLGLIGSAPVPATRVCVCQVPELTHPSSNYAHRHPHQAWAPLPSGILQHEEPPCICSMQSLYAGSLLQHPVFLQPQVMCQAPGCVLCLTPAAALDDLGQMLRLKRGLRLDSAHGDMPGPLCSENTPLSVP